MSINYNGASATDGLIFAYDLGNVRSYKGEPTVNLLDGSTYQDIRNWGGYRQPQDITVLTETYKGSPVYRLANAAGVDPGVYTDKYLMANFPELTSLTVGDTYSFSFDFRVIQKSTVQNNGGASNGAWVWYLTTVNQIAFSDYDEGVWYRANIQATVNSTYDFAIPRIDFDNSIVDVCNFQFEKKPHATQFINGTRTSTESLLNLTGDNPIDLSNQSFDSNAQMTFDGTGDKIDTSISSNNWPEKAFTLEGIVKYESLANHSWFELQRNADSAGLVSVVRNNNFYFYWIDSSGASGHSIESPLIQPNQYIHIVLTFNGVGGSNRDVLYDNTLTYLNGELTPHVPKGSAGISSGGKLFAGSQQYPMNGELPIFKFYDRVLTAEEVAQNFNSLKNRFDL